MTASIPTTDLTQLSDPLPPGLVVLDVREQHEWDAGHIEGAIHIPLALVPVRASELDPSQQTLVVCHLGGRSAQATAWLTQNGHDAVNLEGGMEQWEVSGRPVAR